MSGQKKQTLLAVEIARSLHGTAVKQSVVRLNGNSLSRQILLAGVALAALQPGSAEAVALGELKVNSALGRPFVATTTARIAPGETLTPGCVAAVADMPGGYANPVTLNATVAETSAAGEYPIRITSKTPMYEPMYEIRLNISCPGIAVLAKSYVVMLNVGMLNPQTSIAPPVTQIEQTDAARVGSARITPTPLTIVRPASIIANSNQSSSATPVKPAATETLSPASGAAISAGSKYNVQRGDTLSAIAQRVEGLDGFGARQIARTIFAANPQAFIADNPDLIKMGFVISVPTQQLLMNASNGPEADQSASVSQSVPDTGSNAETILPSEQIQTAAEVAELAAAGSNNLQSSPEQSAEVLERQTNNQSTVTESSAADSITDTSQPEVATTDAVDATAVDGPGQDSGDARIAANELATDSPAADNQLSGTVSGSGATAPVAAQDGTAVSGEMPEPETPAPPQAVPAEPSSNASAAAPTPVTAEQPNQLIAAGSGILAGAFLVALIFGRGLIASWLPARLRVSRETPPDNLSAEAETIVNLDVGEADNPSIAAETSLPNPETDIPAQPEATHSAFEDDFSHADPELKAEVAHQPEGAQALQPEPTEAAAFSTPAEPDSTEVAGTTTDAGLPENEAPRISLSGSEPAADSTAINLSDMEKPTEQTQAFRSLSMLDNDEPAETSELDGTSTMHNLFESQKIAVADSSNLDVTSTMHDIFADEADVLGDNAETTEIPRVESDAIDTGFPRVNIDDTSSLQSLSETIASGSSDDELSKTLTQALVLLEQDYEDELTNSQILDQKDIQKAFAEQAAKDS